MTVAGIYFVIVVGKHRRVETDIYFDNLGTMYKGTYDVHYSKHTTTFNWWTDGGNINIYNSLTTHSL